MTTVISLLIFPAGLSLLLQGLAYEWAKRKMVARLQNRVGPRWFQPLADVVKLLAKEEILPRGVNASLFFALPVISLAGALTSALYVPLLGLSPVGGFPGDLIVAVYLLSLLTLCTGLAGANTPDRFSLLGATRALTQMFSYEAPFLLSLLGPAIAADSWQIGEILAFPHGRWQLLVQPVGFLVALVGLAGKLEMPPFDAPEAETEIVAGALTEYSGRGLAIFRLGKCVELVVGLSLVAAFYMGGVAGPADYFLKTLALLAALAFIQVLMTRLRIDQTVGLWWRFGMLLMLAQVLVVIAMRLLP